jgi:hypothetical protein
MNDAADFGLEPAATGDVPHRIAASELMVL